MDNFPSYLLVLLVGLLIGGLLASNSYFWYRLFSIQAFKEGLIEGLMRGQKLSKGKSKKEKKVKDK
jgi:hypothetical protein